MRARTDIQDIINFIENEGYKLVTTDYKNQKQKLDMFCPKGHLYQVNFENFKSGNRCTTCSQRGRGFTKKDVQHWFQQWGCELVTEDYKNQRQLLDYQCKCGEQMKNTMQRLRHFCKDPYCQQCRRDAAKDQRRKDAEDLMSKIWF